MSLLRHAYRHVPYYRTLFDSLGLSPSDVRTCGMLPVLPPLSQSDLDELAGLLVADDAGLEPGEVWSWREGADGLSLGLHVGSRVRLCGRLQAMLPRLGLVPADFRPLAANCAVVVEGNGHAEGEHSRLPLWRLSRLDRIELGAPADRLARCLARLAKDPPIVLAGTAAALERLAQATPTPRPRAVIVSGGSLSAHDRGRLEAAFACPVIACLAHADVGLIGPECRERVGYHVEDDEVIAETARDGQPAGPGEVGEILVTDLGNHAVPVVRLATGLLGSLHPGPCPCGSHYPLLRLVGAEPAAADSLALLTV